MSVSQNKTKIKIIKILNKIKKKNFSSNIVQDNYFDFYRLDSLDILNFTFELEKIRKKKKLLNPSQKKFRSLKHLISII